MRNSFPWYILRDVGFSLPKLKDQRTAIPPYILQLRESWAMALEHATCRIPMPPDGHVCLVCSSNMLVNGTPIQLCAFCGCSMHPCCGDNFAFLLESHLQKFLECSTDDNEENPGLRELLGDGLEFTWRAGFRLPDFFSDQSE